MGLAFAGMGSIRRAASRGGAAVSACKHEYSLGVVTVLCKGNVSVFYPALAQGELSVAAGMACPVRHLCEDDDTARTNSHTEG